MTETHKGSDERINKRRLQKDIENCIQVLQEGIDTEAAESISIFSNKTSSNQKWTEKLSNEYKLKLEEELQEFEAMKKTYLDKVSVFEAKIENLERLCSEMEELNKELEVKTKYDRSRQPRLSDRNVD